jgi:hypothetical protein
VGVSLGDKQECTKILRLSGLSLHKDLIDRFWVEILAKMSDRRRGTERLTRENVQIDIIRLFDKVCCYVTCANQLYERIAFLIAVTEHDDTRLTEGDHVDLLYERFGKFGDRRLGT